MVAIPLSLTVPVANNFVPVSSKNLPVESLNATIRPWTLGPVTATLMAIDSIENLDPDQLLLELNTTEPFETLDSLIDRAVKSPTANQAGAIATFTGRVRELDHPSDSPTTRLEFEKYAGVAEARLAQICSDLCQRDGIFEVLMHHRVGHIESGQNVVFVVVLGAHRGEAFKTVQDGINRLKNEVPIFKKEIKIDGSFWVHDRP